MSPYREPYNRRYGPEDIPALTEELRVLQGFQRSEPTPQRAERIKSIIGMLLWIHRGIRSVRWFERKKEEAAAKAEEERLKALEPPTLWDRIRAPFGKNKL